MDVLMFGGMWRNPAGVRCMDKQPLRFCDDCLSLSLSNVFILISHCRTCFCLTLTLSGMFLTCFSLKLISHSVFLMRKLRNGWLAIGWQAGIQPIANRSPSDFCVRKTMWIISFNTELTGREFPVNSVLKLIIRIVYLRCENCLAND